jgi:Family of unknown function (DUF6084)
VPDLSFRIEGSSAVAFSAAPELAFAVRIANARPHEPVQSILLRCQIHLDAPARAYSSVEAASLRDLFGEGRVWGRAVRRVLWAHATVVVPAFEVDTVVELHVPCAADPLAAVTRYFAAIREGEVPVVMLFSGTVLHEGVRGGLQAFPVPWSSEARWALPVRTHVQAVEAHHGALAPVVVKRTLLDRLERYRGRAGLASLDQALESLLAREGDTEAARA